METKLDLKLDTEFTDALNELFEIKFKPIKDSLRISRTNTKGETVELVEDEDYTLSGKIIIFKESQGSIKPIPVGGTSSISIGKDDLSRCVGAPNSNVGGISAFYLSDMINNKKS
jgi:hypothetical protein